MERSQSQRYYARRPSIDARDDESASRLTAERVFQAPVMQSYGLDGQMDSNEPTYAYGELHAQDERQRSFSDRRSDHRPQAYSSRIDQITSGSTHPNSRSYAARAHERPDLSLETSRNYAPGSYPLLSSFQDDQYDISRKGSVPDRSPLQKLEVTLGDITKEEKRARIEEAEQRARERAARSGRSMSGRSNDESNGRKHGIARKPVNGNGTRPENQGSQRQRQQDVVNYGGAYLDTNDFNGAQGVLAAASVSRGDNSRASVAQDRTTTFESPEQQDHRYGHDTALTGGAAAAAVNVYQAAKRHQYEPTSPTTDTSTFTKYNRYGGRTGSSQRQSGDYESATGNQHADLMHLGHKQLQGERMGDRAEAKIAQRSKEPDPLPRDDVRINDITGPEYERSPQTADGERARAQVGFGNDDPQQTTLSRHEGQNNRHFSDIIHHIKAPQRRLRGPSALDEWKQGEIVSLGATDLDLDSPNTNDETWWERGEEGRDSIQRTSGRQTQWSHPVRSHDGPHENESVSTTFSPALMLKCGPLLRYTGLKRMTANAPDRTGKEVWRGSVMIVTEDEHSSYSTVPTLRLFKQPTEIITPHTTQTNGAGGAHFPPEHIDLLAGQAKVGRTGNTLFVKPVHHLRGEVDYSPMEHDQGLFERVSSVRDDHETFSWVSGRHGENMGRFREVRGHRLHIQNGVTFWRFNLEVELGSEQARIAYSINRGPAIGFWVPARSQSMNVMFYSCNGFSTSVNPNIFSGPDPLWRDVLNNHQTRPFHCMLGGGDQIYNDGAIWQTKHFQNWLAIKHPGHKHGADFSPEMQEELEQFYLNNYAMWFSQGLFGLANSQIPMVNMWDDHDIIDGFGSYPHRFMSTPVFSGVGAVAFKYYMLFQHQSVVDENEETEPSWLLGASPGPYINELSRSLFIFLSKHTALLALDCRTERMRDEILSQDTYDVIFDRCRREIIQGETKHLIVLLGIPIAYPRLNFLENVLTSRAMDPIKALGRSGMLGGFINRFDGGVEILDDLDDHWTAKHHKHERNWFIQELQELAAEKSVRVTILGGDVHLAAVGRFYSNKKLGIPKDHDHRYMPNIISSAIVNTPPPEMMSDILNKRTRIHHLDHDTDEDMIPIFTHDVNNKIRNNHHLLPRRNWCSIHEYHPGRSRPPTPPPTDGAGTPRRSFSFTRGSALTRSSSLDGRDHNKPGLLRRLSSRGRAPPSAFRSPNSLSGDSNPYNTRDLDPRVDGPLGSSRTGTVARPEPTAGSDGNLSQGQSYETPQRLNSFHRRPSGLSRRASSRDRSGREGYINLEGGLDIIINCEVSQRDPAGYTRPYRLLVPALFYQGESDPNTSRTQGRVSSMLGSFSSARSKQYHGETRGTSYEETEARQTPPLGGRAGSTGHVDAPHMSENQTYDEGSNAHLPIYNAHRTVPRQDQYGDQQPTEKTFRKLPRSRQTGETEMPRRPSLDTYRSARGPEPPKNLSELPISVQKRYSQFDAMPYNENRPSEALNFSRMGSTKRNLGQADERRTYDQPISNYNNTAADRRIVSGPSTTPLAYQTLSPQLNHTPFSRLGQTHDVYGQHHTNTSNDTPRRRASYHGPPSNNLRTTTMNNTAYNRGSLLSYPATTDKTTQFLPPLQSRGAYTTYDDSPPASPPLRSPQRQETSPQEQQQPTSTHERPRRRLTKFQRHYGGFDSAAGPEYKGGGAQFNEKNGENDGLLPPPRPVGLGMSEKAERLLGVHKGQVYDKGQGPAREQFGGHDGAARDALPGYEHGKREGWEQGLNGPRGYVQNDGGYDHAQGYDQQGSWKSGGFFKRFSQGSGRGGGGGYVEDDNGYGQEHGYDQQQGSRKSAGLFRSSSQGNANRGDGGGRSGEGRQGRYSDEAERGGQQQQGNWKTWRWWVDDH